MCLTYSEEASKKFWKTKSRKGKTWCWAYKFYRSDLGTVVTAVVNYTTSVDAGWIKSDRQDREPGEDYYDHDPNQYHSIITRSFIDVNCGIHVISRSQTLPDWHNRIAQYNQTQWNITSPLCLVRVKCYKKDFVGADKEGNAVFMKVFLPKTEYERILK